MSALKLTLAGLIVAAMGSWLAADTEAGWFKWRRAYTVHGSDCGCWAPAPATAATEAPAQAARPDVRRSYSYEPAPSVGTFRPSRPSAPSYLRSKASPDRYSR